MARRLRGPFIRVTNRIDLDRDLDGLSPTQKFAVIGAFVAAVSVSNRDRTDGKLTSKTWAEIGTPRLRATLLGIGWVTEAGDGYEIPAYLHWQPSADEIGAATERGRAAIAERWSRDTERNTKRNTERIGDDDTKRNTARSSASDNDRRSLTGPSRAGAREAGPGFLPDRDDDAQPDYRRGPGSASAPISGRVIPPGSPPWRAQQTGPTPTPPAASALCKRGCGRAHGDAGPCPLDERDPDRPQRRRDAERAAERGRGRNDPMPWHAPRANPPPEIAKRGAAAARAALGERLNRPRPDGETAPAPLGDDAKRALAIRQTASARREREADERARAAARQASLNGRTENTGEPTRPAPPETDNDLPPF